ncbi:MAG: PIG-L family deacetylase [Candidatus Brockarchaeota archaeon]|nr:PIG-L family deacetylase [Candidatus Brockarchaeota archaeon]
MSGKRVLGVGAHPDDLEILCGGTLAKFAKKGYSVVMGHLCRGDKGHFEIESEELAKIRSREAARAAREIGARSVGLGFNDLELYADEKSRKAVVDLIREAKPDIIITHSPNDYMPDHVATSKLVFDASFSATLPNFVTERPAHPVMPAIFYADTLAGIDFQPTDYVDVTDCWQKKVRMLSKHESQLAWLKKHDNIDIIEFVEVVARFRGQQCGVRYAEAFRLCQAWPRIRPCRLLP